MTQDPSQTPKLIAGRVAGILNARELTVNVGSKAGVRVGMKFKVLAEKPVQVMDPETGKELGVVDRVKVRVEASEVQTEFSVCRTYRTYTIGAGFFSSTGVLSDLMSAPRITHETLKADSSSFPPPLSEEESYVKKGDRVLELSPSELKLE